MKKTSNLLAASLLLACCAPTASLWAAEADLSPNTNGGTGHLPSGFSQLNFLMENGDWAPVIRLPTTPTHNDRVSLYSEARWAARLDLAGTAFESARSVGVSPWDLLDLVWNAHAGRWDVQNSRIARALLGPNKAVDRIASSQHLLTQYTMIDGMHAGELHLPLQAPNNAMLTVANRATWSTRINLGNDHNPRWRTCGSLTDCVFAYDTKRGGWHAADRSSSVRPVAELPFPVSGVMRVELNPAIDPATHMTLPKHAVHGDVYVFLDEAGIDDHRVEATHTSMPASRGLAKGQELRMRYSGIDELWHVQN